MKRGIEQEEQVREDAIRLMTAIYVAREPARGISDAALTIAKAVNRMTMLYDLIRLVPIAPPEETI